VAITGSLMSPEITANRGMRTTEDLTLTSGNLHLIANQDTHQDSQKNDRNQSKKTQITRNKTIKNKLRRKRQMNMAN
jgi:hypothetical protein